VSDDRVAAYTAALRRQRDAAHALVAAKIECDAARERWSDCCYRARTHAAAGRWEHAVEWGNRKRAVRERLARAESVVANAEAAHEAAKAEATAAYVYQIPPEPRRRIRLIVG